MAQKSRLYTYPNGQPSDGQKLQLEFDNIYEGVSNIDSTQIQAGIITTDKIANGAVTEAKIATGAVTNAKLADGAVTDAKVSSTANIAQTKINNTTGWISTSLSTANDNATLAVNTANSAEAKANSAEAKANSALVTANEALSAGTGAVVSETVIVNNLYASRGRIAELTVDELDTSTKVKKYLDGDKSQIFYTRIYENKIQLIEAFTDGVETEQLTDRNGNLLYWIDEEHIGKGITDEITDFPINTYKYEEAVKYELLFETDGTKVPKMIWGQGLGNPAFPDRGKGYIFKDETGLVLRYISAFGHDRFIKLGEDGIEGVDSDAKTIDIYENGLSVEYADGKVHDWDWTKDSQGRIDYVINNTTNLETTINWKGGYK